MIPERFAPHTCAVMRIMFGTMFMTHGLQKLGLFGDDGAYVNGQTLLVDGGANFT